MSDTTTGADKEPRDGRESQKCPRHTNQITIATRKRKKGRTVHDVVFTKARIDEDPRPEPSPTPSTVPLGMFAGLPNESDMLQPHPEDHVFPSNFEMDLHPEPVTAVNCAPTTKPKRVRDTNAFKMWLEHRQDTLEQFLIMDGLGSPSRDGVLCGSCSASFPVDEPALRCISCCSCPVLCKTCLIKLHALQPFHLIEIWKGAFWERDRLHQYGITYQLGHGGLPCAFPRREDTLTVLDVTGQHSVSVRYCLCSLDVKERSERTQLIRARFFPASFIHPKTAFSFQLLDTVIVMTGRGRASAYDFYMCLRSLTDPCDLSNCPKRYDEFNVAVRRYRDMLMHKRAGRGHVPDGIKTTSVGELAIQCPALPYPGRNMPSDWVTRFEDSPHLKALYVGADANFRHKEKEREKAAVVDTGLIAGGGYFGVPSLFEQEKERVENMPPSRRQEKSSCESSFSAVERANTRGSCGFRVSGVVAVIDTRYGFLLPNAVADLQKGERYFNTDFAFLSAVREFDEVLDIYVSYDIACRWGIHKDERWSQFPPELSDRPKTFHIRLAVPKFHLPAHGRICWSQFSLNYIPGSARIDGEAIERFWAWSNPVAPSTQEMGHGTRHDFLEARWNMSNFRKLVELDSTMSRRLTIAVEGRTRHSKELEDFSAPIPEPIIKEWTNLIHLYHLSPKTNKDPYQTQIQEFTTADVERELCAEEATAAALGEHAPDPSREVTEVDFLVLGLEIEYTQRKLRIDSSKPRPSLTESSLIDKRRAALGRRITPWLAQQAIFMSGAASIRSLQVAGTAEDPPSQTSWEEEEEPEVTDNPEGTVAYPLGIKAEVIDLILPSHQLASSQNLCSRTLVNKELRLRIGRMEGYLKKLRHHLRVKASAYHDKVINSVEYARKIDEVATHYREERAAALRLDPNGIWRRRLQELKPGDVRAASQDEGVGERNTQPSGSDRAVWNQSRRTISWIWKMPPVEKEHAPIDAAAGSLGGGRASAIDGGSSQLQGTSLDPTGGDAEEASEEELGEALRVEWAKAYARACRYVEEVELVIEEMKRVHRYFNWKVSWWEKRLGGRVETSLPLAMGCDAYAHKQIALLRKLDAKFTSIWKVTLSRLGVAIDPDTLDDLD